MIFWLLSNKCFESIKKAKIRKTIENFNIATLKRMYICYEKLQLCRKIQSTMSTFLLIVIDFIDFILKMCLLRPHESPTHKQSFSCFFPSKRKMLNRKKCFFYFFLKMDISIVLVSFFICISLSIEYFNSKNRNVICGCLNPIGEF